MALIVLSFNNINNSATILKKDPCWKLESIAGKPDYVLALFCWPLSGPDGPVIAVLGHLCSFRQKRA